VQAAIGLDARVNALSCCGLASKSSPSAPLRPPACPLPWVRPPVIFPPVDESGNMSQLLLYVILILQFDPELADATSIQFEGMTLRKEGMVFIIESSADSRIYVDKRGEKHRFTMIENDRVKEWTSPNGDALMASGLDYENNSFMLAGKNVKYKIEGNVVRFAEESAQQVDAPEPATNADPASRPQPAPSR